MDLVYQTGLLKMIHAGLQEGRREFGFTWYGTQLDLFVLLHATFQPHPFLLTASCKHSDTYHLFFEEIPYLGNESVNGFTPTIPFIRHENQGYERQADTQ